MMDGKLSIDAQKVLFFKNVNHDINEKTKLLQQHSTALKLILG